MVNYKIHLRIFFKVTSEKPKFYHYGFWTSVLTKTNKFSSNNIARTKKFTFKKLQIYFENPAQLRTRVLIFTILTNHPITKFHLKKLPM